MTLLLDLIAVLSAGSPNPLALPEYRQIELYSKRKALTFAAPEASHGVPLDRIAGVCRAFMVLDAVLASRNQSVEGMASWQWYLELPRTTQTDRMVAELYRVLRVARTVAFDPQSVIEMQNGVVKIKGIVNKVVLILDVSSAGLMLLESAVAYYLDALRQPYPAAYVESLLAQYFHDIVDEIRRYSDEGRSLYQFRAQPALNRHFRFDCDNPKVRVDSEFLEIEIGAAQRNPALYPIDFFVTLGDVLHIIPVEALTDGRLPLAELDRWRARTADGTTLPANFRPRFGRDIAAVNQPMT
jgi:hypothetical protein